MGRRFCPVHRVECNIRRTGLLVGTYTGLDKFYSQHCIKHAAQNPFESVHYSNRSDNIKCIFFEIRG